jgi:hypothetical protein
LRRFFPRSYVDIEPVQRMEGHEDLGDRQERAAQNQALFREVNERVNDVNDRFGGFTTVSDWLCECANDSCTKRVELATQEYEQVRSDGARFFVAPGDEHVWPEVERVIERHPNYWVVEKVERGAEIAMQRDPRSARPLTFET